ncbi:MAG: hypothetical protein M0T85_15935 [Dehalococcoidales bacterium]|nr:hypothetical protein [Dehalococcoidales bacterium]
MASRLDACLIAALILLMPVPLPAGSLRLPLDASTSLTLSLSNLLSLAVVASWLFAAVGDRRESRLAGIVATTGIGFAFLVATSIVWSAAPVASLERALQVAIMVAVTVVAADHPRRFVLAAWAIGAAVQALVGLAQFLVQHSLGLGWLGEPQWVGAANAQAVISAGSELWARAPGLTLHPNILGAYCAVGLAAALTIALRAKGHLRLLWWITLCLIIAGEMVAFSRAGWLAAGIAVAIVLAGGMLREPEARARATSLGVLVMSVVGVFVLAYPQLFAARMLLSSADGGLNISPYEIANLALRTSSQEYALRAIATRPALGMGAGAYGVGVYSAPLWIAAELGLTGLLLWAFWLGSALIVAIRRAAARRSDAYGSAALAALSAIVVGSLFNPDVWSADAGRLMLAVTLGLGATNAFSRSAAFTSVLARLAVPQARYIRSALLPAASAIGLGRVAALVPLLFLPLSAALASGQPLSLSPNDAVQIAVDHIAREAGTGIIPEWQGASAGPAVPYYDFQGATAAYVVEVKRAAQQVGYVTVSARGLPNPVLEFGRAPAYHRLHTTQIESLAASGLRVDREHPLYVGPLSYYYPAEEPGTGQVYLIDMITGQFEPSPLLPGPAQPPPMSAGRSGNGVSPNAIGLPAYRLLPAPAYIQFWYNGCYVGCVPTASGIMMGYWADRNYPGLIAGGSSGDYYATIKRLNILMGTFCEGDGGWTYFSQISPAMMAYTQERGYTFRSDWLWLAPTYTQYMSEIDASRPIQV